MLIVSETFAREMFPGQRAVGKRIGFYSARPGGTPPPTREIVGVVRDVRQDGVSRRPIAQMYSPYAQIGVGLHQLLRARRRRPVRASPASVQRAVSSVDPMRPVRDVKSTTEIVRSSTGTRSGR